MDSIARTPKQIGSALRRFRKKKQLTQTELGGKTGLRQATISEIENGDRAASLSTLIDILAALDLELLVRPRSKGSADDIEDLF